MKRVPEIAGSKVPWYRIRMRENVELTPSEREEIVQWWLGADGENDLPGITDGCTSYSTRDIAEAIRAGTREGMAFVMDLLRLREIAKQETH